MNIVEHWPAHIVAVTDGENSPAALIEYRELESGEQAESSDVEYVRADLYHDAVEALRKLADIHHSTIKPSKLHNPYNLDWTNCKAKSCQLAQSVVGR